MKVIEFQKRYKGSYLYSDIELKYEYIKDVFDTLIVRDIRQKYKIRNIALMDRLVDFLMDNVSNLTSARNIVDTLTLNKDKIKHKTISSYIQYLCIKNDIVAYSTLVVRHI